MEADEFQTYDQGLPRFALETGLTIREPVAQQLQLPGGEG